VVMKNLKV